MKPKKSNQYDLNDRVAVNDGEHEGEVGMVIRVPLDAEGDHVPLWYDVILDNGKKVILDEHLLDDEEPVDLDQIRGAVNYAKATIWARTGKWV